MTHHFILITTLCIKRDNKTQSPFHIHLQITQTQVVLLVILKTVSNILTYGFMFLLRMLCIQIFKTLFYTRQDDENYHNRIMKMAGYFKCSFLIHFLLKLLIKPQHFLNCFQYELTYILRPTIKLQINQLLIVPREFQLVMA